ncbi:low temperature requirement protein A [Plantactinospora endophytica]|uniref:Membrane protein n=1 Tax=Plantactinospora endophytica TaxID=673535 RepID=A0ABQ4DWY2_9ACTN|nr:low temperature requirement protein A [Plantactinospora endophytica]GIG86969.1 membrane protein [Plantactinospora endophytica]
MTDANNGLLRRAENSQRATFLELFFDLVFVFALTRISDRLIDVFETGRRLPFYETYQTLLLFLAIWLIWTITALVTSRLDPDRPVVQFVVVATMLGALVMAVAVPHGLHQRATVFAGAYVTLQLGRSLLLLRPNRQDRTATIRSIVWFGLTAVLWLIGAFVPQVSLRVVLWTTAIVTDCVGVMLGWPTPKLGRTPISETAIAGEHLAERYQQFLLIALGESILVIGLTFSGANFVADHTSAFLLSFLTTVLLWRVYFHRAGHVLPTAITSARHPARLGISAAFSHLPMLAGIVLTAVGYELSIAHPFGDTAPAWLVAILGGPTLFLAGRAAFEHQIFARISRSRLYALVTLVVLAPALAFVPPLAVSAAAAAVLAAVAGADILRSRNRPPERPTPPVRLN